mgnify:CR=1 FL=1
MLELTNPDHIPLPPEKVEILDFKASPYPDGKRVKIILTFTPFQKNPSAEIIIKDPDNKIKSKIQIIETIESKSEITMHLPGKQRKGEYTAHTEAFYLAEKPSDDDPETIQGVIKDPIDQASTRFIIP